MSAQSPAPLTGGTAVWIFMTVEVITFGLFFMGHAWGWRSDPTGFAAAQALLHPGSAARGTAILLIGSWLAYQAVLENQAGARSAGRWLGAAALAGLAFAVNKVLEYQSPELADITLSSGPFWFSYLFLTGLHLLHVLGGVVALGVVGWSASRGEYGPGNALPVEAVAAYWHLVDLVWVLLFPILYVMHP